MPDEQIEKQPEASVGINILDPKMKEEVDITLTKGQALFIFKILEVNIQPRGLEMVEFAYDLMKRFDGVRDIEEALASDATPETPETVGFGAPVAEEKPKIHDMSPKNPLGE